MLTCVFIQVVNVWFPSNVDVISELEEEEFDENGSQFNKDANDKIPRAPSALDTNRYMQ
jgi:hypothetical protein